MSKISVELPVKLEELCQFTFNFNNLIKIIDYLHQNNLSLQQEMKDIDKRLVSMENLKTDIEDLKIKTTNIERTNENINRSLSNIHENVLKFDSKISDVQIKANDVESKVKKYEIIQNDQVQNINHLNKVAEENTKKLEQLNESININSKNITQISDKLEEHEKNNKEEFEKINNSLKEINELYEKDHKEIEDINNNIGDINESITNMMNDFEKKNSEMNSRVINIISDIADINNNILNLENIYTNNANNNITNNNTKNENEASPNIVNAINKDMNNSNLFKIAMDEIEEEKNKFNKLKDDYEIFKDRQKKENDNIKRNINEIINEFSNLKKEVDENAENIEKIENNYNNYINIKYEEMEGDDKSNKNKSIDLNHLSNYLNTQLSKYVRFDVFKKLSDNVRIIGSTISSKSSQEEIEKIFKKFNQRLETVEMIQQGITHGPKTRIDLGLVNMKFESGTNISGEYGNIKEVDYIIKTVEKKLKGNLIDTINKEINNIDFSSHPKINELIENNSKNTEDIDKNSKDILDIKNILITNPSQNDFIKLKTEFDNILEEIKTNRLKIIELTKNIEGTEEDDDDSGENDEENKNIMKGTIKDKIKFLNKTCQNLNVKLNNLEVKHKSMTKEVKDGIKQNLKIETVKIMQQFKQRLETFTTKFESELKNKIDQIGLSDFETKINNRLYYDLKEKLDKNELKKNNNMMKRKIEGLENKISKTLVDTIIDLQMDDQPLIVKKNGNGLDICASCNQPKPRNTIYESGERDFYPINIKNVNRVKNMNKTFINYSQGSNNNNKSNSNNNDKSFNLNLSLGQNKLPEIIPSLHQK